MNPALLLRIAPGTRYRAALVGVGQFGHSFVFQAERNPLVEVCALCDREPGRAIAAYRAAGVPADSIVVCDGAGAARAALGRGARVVLTDAAPLAELGVDIVIEATGDPETAATNAAAALEAGCHVAMVSKEADCTIGPALARRAATRGLVYTPVDGDQPSLLIGLIRWAELIGLEIVAAGKSCEHDFVFDSRRGVVASNRIEVPAPALSPVWEVEGPIAAIVAARSAAVVGLARQTVPDLAELTVVANATGLKPDAPALHAPLLRTPEVPSALCPREDGGLLDRRGALEVFCALRAPGDVSFAGGVFVVVRCADEPTWQVLRDKGIPVARNGRHALLYNPQHLLGIEAIASVITACAARAGTGGEAPRPVCDVVARADATLTAGTRLDLGARHSLPGVVPLMLDAVPALGNNPVPYYLAAGATLVRDVPAGAILRCDDLVPRDHSVAWALRREQDRLFFDVSPDVLT